MTHESGRRVVAGRATLEGIAMIAVMLAAVELGTDAAMVENAVFATLCGAAFGVGRYRLHRRRLG